jgi:hypothetical protein
VLLFAFLGLVYNLNWLVSLIFATVTTRVYSSLYLSYSFFIRALFIFIELVPLCLLFLLVWWYSLILLI